MEAVKQGSACIGLKSKDYAVLVGLKRASCKLSAPTKKIIPIDDHIGIAIAGLTADARVLTRYLRNECLRHFYSHDEPLPLSKLLSSLGLKMQACTQRYDRRPYGVGLLIAGYDSKGPHIYQTCPSSAYFDCKCMAIGARSQSARTYLEKHLDTFASCDLQQLVKHSLYALRECLPNDSELTTQNVTIAVVGKEKGFTQYDDGSVEEWLNMIPENERKGRKDRSRMDDEPAAPEAAAAEEHMAVD